MTSPFWNIYGMKGTNMNNHKILTLLTLITFLLTMHSAWAMEQILTHNNSSKYSDYDEKYAEEESSQENSDSDDEYADIIKDYIDDYPLKITRVQIDAHEENYDFLIRDNNKDDIASATYSVWNKLTLQEKKDLLRDELFSNIECPTIILESSTLIILHDLEILDINSRKQGLGTKIFKKAVAFFKNKYPDAIMVWIAEPIGEEKLSFEALCNFYNKNNGTLFHTYTSEDKSKTKQKYFGYYYLSLNPDAATIYKNMVQSIVRRRKKRLPDKKNRILHKVATSVRAQYDKKN